MIFTDTHTHIFVKEFDNDRQNVIENAINNGVKKMILPCINVADINILLELSQKYPKNIFPAAGLHPSEVKPDYEKELEIISEQAKTGKFIAIGETGIDLYWDKTFADIQKKAFEEQINIAKRDKLPVIIHVRNAFDEVFEIVEKNLNDDLSGVFHSFTGNIDQAKRICSYKNFKIGINGIVTFKNSGLDKVISATDINKILLETDSPYLSPVPKRGQRNESAHLIFIAKKISEIKNIDIKDLAKITEKNTEELFGRKLA